MLRKTIIAGSVLAILICLPFTVYAKSDATSIGISVEIKAKQSCDYSYAMEVKGKLHDSRNTHFSECDINVIKLQQQANKIASSEFKNTQSQMDSNRLRVFIAVQ